MKLVYDICRCCYLRNDLDPDDTFFRYIRVQVKDSPYRKQGIYKKKKHTSKTMNVGIRLVPRKNKSGYTYEPREWALKDWFKFGDFKCAVSRWFISSKKNPPKKCPYILEHMVSQKGRKRGKRNLQEV